MTVETAAGEDTILFQEISDRGPGIGDRYGA